MKKTNKNKAVTSTKRSPEKACVGGSIPSLGTTFKLPKHIKLLEIPEGWRLIPAVRWRRGVPEHFRVLEKTPRKRWGRGGDRLTKRKSA